MVTLPVRKEAGAITAFMTICIAIVFLLNPDAYAFTAKKIPILMYHNIDVNDPDFGAGWGTVRNFRHQMILLHDLGYKTVNYDDLLNDVNDIKELPPKAVIVSFDDGYQNVYEYAPSIMHDIDPNFHGVMHIITDFVGDGNSTSPRQSNTWDPGQPTAWHMIWPEVRSLCYDANWSIESHSRTHKHTSAVDYNAVYEAGSAAVIASKGIPEPNFYVYPYGESVDNQTLINAGYLGGVDADGGIEDTNTTEVWDIKRIPVSLYSATELGYRPPRTVRPIDEFANFINVSVPDEANHPRLDIRIWSHKSGGKVVATPDRPYYEKNSDVNLVAVPYAGYHFVEWTGTAIPDNDPTATLNVRTITMDKSYDVFANFGINQYTVTASADANGTISPPGATVVNYGDSKTFTATPFQGYEIDKWTLDGNDIQAGGLTYTLSNITAPHTIAVSFKLLTYTVTASAGANGTVAPLSAVVNYNGSQEFTAAPSAGYAVDKWTLDGSDIQTGGLTYTLSNITTGHTVAVSFKRLIYTISGYIKNGCNVPINGVSVEANNSGGHTVTDASGFYQVWVDYNWTGTVTPAKKDYTFEPNSMSYVGITENKAETRVYDANNMYDLDCNGSIGEGDLAIIANNWLSSNSNAQGNFNHDEILNFLDFALFAQRWLER